MPEDAWRLALRALARMALHATCGTLLRAMSAWEATGLSTPKGESLMDISEVEQKETLTREEVANVFTPSRTCWRAQRDHFERAGMKFTVHVPEEVQLKVELEIETDERELEIELKW